MIILPFSRENLEGFVYDGVEQNLSGSDVLDIAEYYSNLGKGFIGISDDKIIGVGGVCPLWGKWGSAWLFLNKEAQYHKVGVFKAILEVMNDLIDLYKIEMLSVQCLNNSPEANNLLSHLGFTKSQEFKMAIYGRKI